MKALGQIGSVEIAVEEIVRKVALDNDRTTERLSREAARAEARLSEALSENANLRAENDRLREELEAARILTELPVAGAA